MGALFPRFLTCPHFAELNPMFDLDKRLINKKCNPTRFNWVPIVSPESPGE